MSMRLTLCLRESFCSPMEELSKESDVEKEIPVKTLNIKVESFVLMKLKKEKDCFTLCWTGGGKIQSQRI